MIRVLVTGSHTRVDVDAVMTALQAFTSAHGAENLILIHGNADCVDAAAAYAARTLRWASVIPYPAQWKAFGLSAGPKRNQQMLREGKPDICFAFPGDRGTADMVRRCERAGVPVQRC